MFQLALLLGAMFLLQGVLSVIQMRHFSKEFVKLRRQGKVACGRKSGGFHAGAIVLFRIDEDGVIQEGRKLMGVTCFARVTDLPGFEGKFVGGLTEAALPLPAGGTDPDRSPPAPAQNTMKGGFLWTLSSI